MSHKRERRRSAHLNFQVSPKVDLLLHTLFCSIIHMEGHRLFLVGLHSLPSPSKHRGTPPMSLQEIREAILASEDMWDSSHAHLIPPVRSWAQDGKSETRWGKVWLSGVLPLPRPTSSHIQTGKKASLTQRSLPLFFVFVFLNHFQLSPNRQFIDQLQGAKSFFLGIGIVFKKRRMIREAMIGLRCTFSDI